MVSQRMRLAETLARRTIAIKQLVALYASLALGMVRAEALGDIWAGLCATQVRWRCTRGTHVLSVWMTDSSARLPDVEGSGPDLVLATRDAVGKLITWHQARLAQDRERADDLERRLDQLERCFACAGPPGSCATCTPSTTKVAATAA